MEPATTQNSSSKSHRELVATIGILVVIVLIASLAIISSQKKTDGKASTSSTHQSTTANNASAYKDGTYSATGHYDSPGGQEAISVSLTLRSNGVTTSSVTRNVTTDDEAEMYQNDFIGGYKQFVEGKPLNSISVSHVSGSSLTSQGFNDALQQIKSQARA